MKFTVRVRIITPHNRAIHEDQIYEADTGLDAMKKAQADEKNTSRGLVQTNGADPMPLESEPVIETKGEPERNPIDEANAPAHPHPADVPETPKRGRPPKYQTTPVD